MITRQDVQQAINECLAIRNPTANTAIKLAAFYIIMEHIDGNKEDAIKEAPGQSFAPAPSGFSQMIAGKSPDVVASAIDELLDAVSVLNPRLYDAFMRKLEEN